MMYRIRRTAPFKAAYKRAQKRGLKMDLLHQVIETLAKGEALSPVYRDHALTGTLTGYRDCHIQPDWLLIYKLEQDILVLTLVSTGTHADLF